MDKKIINYLILCGVEKRPDTHVANQIAKEKLGVIFTSTQIDHFFKRDQRGTISIKEKIIGAEEEDEDLAMAALPNLASEVIETAVESALIV